MKNNFQINKILFLLLLPPILSHAGNEKSQNGARALGMGGAFTAVQGDVWNMYSSIGGLAKMKRFTVGGYFERRFMLSELTYKSFTMAVPFSFGTAGADVSYFGYSLYHELAAGIAFARTFYEKFHAGLKVNYFNTAFSDAFYGSASAVSVNAGFVANVTKEFNVGFHGYNLTLSKLGTVQEKIPIVLTGGIAYMPSKKILIAADYEKDIDFPARFKAGLEYKIIDKLPLRAGVATEPTEFAAGFGLKLDFLEIDFATSLHQTLGFTPHFSVNYIFK